MTDEPGNFWNVVAATFEAVARSRWASSRSMAGEARRKMAKRTARAIRGEGAIQGRYERGSKNSCCRIGLV